MAVRPQDKKEEGPGVDDPAHKNEVPEIVLEDDTTAEKSALQGEPEVGYAPPKPELSKLQRLPR